MNGGSNELKNDMSNCLKAQVNVYCPNLKDQIPNWELKLSLHSPVCPVHVLPYIANSEKFWYFVPLCALVLHIC